MRTYVVDFMARFDYPSEAQTDLIQAYDALISDSEGADGLRRLMVLYQENIQLEFDEISNYAINMEQKIGVHSYQSILLVLICFSKHLKSLYEKNNIDERIWFNTMLDLKYKLFECKEIKHIWGTFVGSWLLGFFRFTRFGIGRLEYDIKQYDRDDYTHNGKTITRGMPVFNVHIPKTGTPFDAAACDESFAMAKEFFRDICRDVPMAFICTSWLLYPNYMDLLPEASNIRSFASRFDIIASLDDSPEKTPNMWYIFGMDYTGNLDDYPEDSSLRRRMKAYLKNGGKTGRGCGIFFA